MTKEEHDMVMKLGDLCRQRGCTCLRRCWEAFNGLKFWPEKAGICTHPNALQSSGPSCDESTEAKTAFVQATFGI